MWIGAVVLLLAAAAVQAVQNAPSTIPKVDGLRFNFDGATKYHAGTNAYWLPFLTNNADVDLVLDHMASAELRVVRTWGFNDVNIVPTNGDYRGSIVRLYRH
jgi:mannan endo-1,4-beta-mannosidase